MVIMSSTVKVGEYYKAVILKINGKHEQRVVSDEVFTCKDICTKTRRCLA